MRKKIFYHVTNPKNVKSIMKHGLKCDEEGNIFVFTDPFFANAIARDQCFLMKGYALLQIDARHLEGSVEPDRVAEWPARFQRIVKQDRIAPELINHLNNFSTIYKKPTQYDYMVLQKLFGRDWTCKQTDQYYKINNWHHRHQIKGDIEAKELEEEYARRLKKIGINYIVNAPEETTTSDKELLNC